MILQAYGCFGVLCEIRSASWEAEVGKYVNASGGPWFMTLRDLFLFAIDDHFLESRDLIHLDFNFVRVPRAWKHSAQRQSPERPLIKTSKRTIQYIDCGCSSEVR